MSDRSSCLRAGIGCVIVGADQRIVATGYNGPPAGLTAALDSSIDCGAYCPRAFKPAGESSYSDCVSVHAEMNAIAYADRSRMEGGTLYVTGAMCWDCAKVVANSGITRVFHVIDRDRQVDKVENLLSECGVEIWQVPSPHEEIASNSM